mmetsp:Transcript_62042/g.142808  ORF Transcript_62042/g.142808 Transcript_62042/m.142808 type:complete len:229 (+) Transcript_62042:25-711(+)
MKFFPVLIISVLAEQCHELLQVAPSTRDEAVLKRAYRKAALKWHPDKNTAPEAVEKFRRVADCYEEMVSGRDGSTGFSRSREPRSRRDAETMFNDFFGDVWRRWQPGSKTVGSFVRNGKKVQITIWEDGSSEEVVSEGRGDYTVLSESSPGSYQLHIQGNPFEILAQQMETFFACTFAHSDSTNRPSARGSAAIFVPLLPLPELHVHFTMLQVTGAPSVEESVAYLLH